MMVKTWSGRLAVLVAGLTVATGYAGCGSNDDSSARELAKERQIAEARAEARREARNEARIRELERRLRDRKNSGSGGSSGSGGTSTSGGTSGSGGPPAPTGPSSGGPVAGTSCGGDLYAGPDTSCPFAENVRSTYYDQGGGDITITVHSPVTGLDYTVACSSGVSKVCIANTGAKVYFR